jgi:hypothetical protein
MEAPHVLFGFSNTIGKNHVMDVLLTPLRVYRTQIL